MLPVIKGDLELTHEFVERGERGHAMHAGTILYAQSSLGKLTAGNAVRPARQSSVSQKASAIK